MPACILFQPKQTNNQQTYGGNVFSYITKDGIQVMGTRADAPNPQKDEKPYAGERVYGDISSSFRGFKRLLLCVVWVLFNTW